METTGYAPVADKPFEESISKEIPLEPEPLSISLPVSESLLIEHVSTFPIPEWEPVDASTILTKADLKRRIDWFSAFRVMEKRHPAAVQTWFSDYIATLGSKWGTLQGKYKSDAERGRIRDELVPLEVRSFPVLGQNLVPSGLNIQSGVVLQAPRELLMHSKIPNEA